MGWKWILTTPRKLINLRIFESQVLTQPNTSSMTLDYLLFSVPQFPHLQNKNKNQTNVIELL